MGLEAALLGKPVIMLGESAVTLLPSASAVGEITELPELIRRKLAETRPSRAAIVDGYAAYLAPFLPAAHNDWRVRKSEREIDGFVELLRLLSLHVGRDYIGVAGGMQP